MDKNQLRKKYEDSVEKRNLHKLEYERFNKLVKQSSNYEDKFLEKNHGQQIDKLDQRLDRMADKYGFFFLEDSEDEN